MQIWRSATLPSFQSLDHTGPTEQAIAPASIRMMQQIRHINVASNCSVEVLVGDISVLRCVVRRQRIFNIALRSAASIHQPHPAYRDLQLPKVVPYHLDARQYCFHPSLSSLHST